MIKKIIKEPLFHFLLLGALLYFASMMWGEKNNQTQEIIVTEGKIKHLQTLYKKTWQREPTQQELENVVQEYILEQAAYYEGINLGLDKNDIVIVRRIHQKLDFLAEENTPIPEATDERLNAYLQEHADKFLLESIFTLQQVYLDPNKHKDIRLEAQNILNKLTTEPDQDISRLGDSYLFKPRYQDQSLTELERLFGKEFVQETKQLLVGKWHGPIQSGYGIHLVYIEQKQLGSLPELAQVRNMVLREWKNDLHNQSTKNYYDNLLKRYPVSIHWPTD